ncbi:hypothetical protein LTR91_010110 [Friedmanniomyces endolithicus]|uniref:SRP9 domain-containing protein n=1 Tax=Friedmanniomyces endolithicus TaxID=329885 RepID=A0AAN6QT84_9PEZI|nr:hypothetical protein LTR94_019140 [Friedmanniomyces endolithicus]KAK0774741.1 hypothetical protein LTR59_014771 [Friedmanniomyces endolithicus]KAK0786151.1 hypothetical protein LTR38_012103 [Friedmanniomyces endolithicus]KAK0790108.1 hypothetical protein LTR75_012129 [Friedmanniomyces endolithicus]KAK0854395.1 hypothetical protein LTR03_002426 [Friedmanniomyces endolithicus]
MVYLKTPEEWQHHSALLLQARPTTTRITTKYKIPDLASPRYQKPNKRKRDGGEGEEKEQHTGPKVPRAALVLKTYDPESGVVLKLKTDKGADVGRLIGGLGRLGRRMAALPEKAEEAVMEDAEVAEQAPVGGATAPNGKETAAAATGDGKALHASGGGGGGGGGAKKKKKGKK